ncbi:MULTISPECIES: DUF2066 domain-containing protein [Oleiagrimonas]|jgi:hypothetical protein|uniref:DUF2066 domain-containing protein n=1 Tax=Oleiagrimonas citrea TaxID=1665687 RepID=A0A846ZQC6_9GAMM|nr:MULTISPECIES: DUF2066 domain-containing protein [Oleiagrimonas]NKZ39689.1 DUF2066 domain-containing protein [Oleiagrimonas citrea]RAP59355.1 hypothetical protein BTJ49_01430 [Oleiagrimonas sp. MCCC 1A03011]
MRIRSLLILALALVCAVVVPPRAHAQNAGYGVTVPVSDTSDAQRDHAFAVALGDVLTRTAGASITGASGYTDALGTASSLVQNYRYLRAAAGASRPFLLQVQFDPAAVQELAGSLQKQLAAQNASAVAPTSAASAAMPGASAMSRQDATLWVAPMQSGLDLPQLLSVLRANPQVASVEPIGADGDGVMLRLHARSAISTVLPSLQASGHLQRDAVDHPGADVSLRWLR